MIAGLALLLSACGGGGGATPPPTPPPTPLTAGLYLGTLADGRIVTAVVGKTGLIIVNFSRPGRSAPDMVVKGAAAPSTGGTWSTTFTAAYVLPGNALPTPGGGLAMSGTYTAQALTAHFTEAGVARSVDLHRVSSDPAGPVTFTGTFTGTLNLYSENLPAAYPQPTVTLTVAAPAAGQTSPTVTGTLTSTQPAGTVQVSGTLVPRTDLPAYDLTLTLSTADAALGNMFNGTFAGMAIFDGKTPGRLAVGVFPRSGPPLAGSLSGPSN